MLYAKSAHKCSTAMPLLRNVLRNKCGAMCCADSHASLTILYCSLCTVLLVVPRPLFLRNVQTRRQSVCVFLWPSHMLKVEPQTSYNIERRLRTSRTTFIFARLKSERESGQPRQNPALLISSGPHLPSPRLTNSRLHLAPNHPTTAALPNTLAELLHKAKLLAGPPAPPTTTASPTRKPHNNSDHDVIESHDDHAGNNSTALPVLLEIARFVLPSHGGAGSGGGGDGWAGTTRPKARSRALALDCLRLGLLLPMLLPRPGGEDGNGSLAREAFAAASVGGRDERWEVRAAAARAAGEALRLGGIGELLSSQQVSLLPEIYERETSVRALSLVRDRCILNRV